MWIARDKDGELFVYKQRPFRNGDVFNSAYGMYGMMAILNYEYPEVTWENSPKELVVKMD